MAHDPLFGGFLNAPILVTITTNNPDLHAALVNMRIDGIRQNAPLRKDWPTAGWQVIVELMTFVAGGLFLKLLTDLVDKYDDTTCKINGRHIQPGTASAARIARIIDGLVIDNHLERHAKESQEDVDS